MVKKFRHSLTNNVAINSAGEILTALAVRYAGGVDFIGNRVLRQNIRLLRQYGRPNNRGIWT